MASPIAIAAALSRLVPITCPHCGAKKAVDRQVRRYRVCARCHRRFPDPRAPRKP
jgi:uncharacterized protein (DUF983 family)